MFIAKVQGGLGNQLFQWALVKHLSIKYNAPAYLDLSYFSHQTENTHRQFSLSKFPSIKYCSEIKVGDRPRQLQVVKDDFTFRDFIYNENFNYYFDGYWQCSKYFNESEQIIRDELRPSTQAEKRFMEVTVGKSKVVSLHIRRTDYLNYIHIHPLLPISYYEEALSLLPSYDCLMVFSDDIDWCKKNLSFNNMTFVEGQDEIEDLWMMSLCKYNVIANSSFSWWAAWLNSNAERKVVAPKLWFGPACGLSSDNIIPDDWLKV